MNPTPQFRKWAQPNPTILLQYIDMETTSRSDRITAHLARAEQQQNTLLREHSEKDSTIESQIQENDQHRNEEAPSAPERPNRPTPLTSDPHPCIIENIPALVLADDKNRWKDFSHMMGAEDESNWIVSVHVCQKSML